MIAWFIVVCGGITSSSGVEVWNDYRGRIVDQSLPQVPYHPSDVVILVVVVVVAIAFTTIAAILHVTYFKCLSLHVTDLQRWYSLNITVT